MQVTSDEGHHAMNTSNQCASINRTVQKESSATHRLRYDQDRRVAFKLFSDELTPLSSGSWRPYRFVSRQKHVELSSQPKASCAVAGTYALFCTQQQWQIRNNSLMRTGDGTKAASVAWVTRGGTGLQQAKAGFTPGAQHRHSCAP